ncbi:BACON domain-containing carbohydrate-binding protein [Bacteroides gallinaceum]|uniref:BACON domain-containing carbohydrate-binding protein n=1 Tax=Bacteroides gallinaceum TaxID=1462571 RepID=A0ABT7X4P2_9BACE|nr:BACON domain-containing carbohydrate-binding protein [Bacteroides gallinaceum]MDN0049061.1 BACON domain-containing carbohydrate-binding protein [Bacteroides gallinaceum]
MKQNLFVLPVLGLLLMLCQGCSEDKEENPPAPESPSITVESEEDIPVFDTAGGTLALTFTTTSDWTASVDGTASGWLSVSPASGEAGTHTLSLVTTANDSYDERNASVTITSGSVKKTLTVTQKQKDALLLTSNKVELEAEGGDFSIELQANVEVTYEIESGAQTWLTPVARSRGLTSSFLAFHAEANEEAEARQAVIKLAGGNGLTEEVTVYQMGTGPALVLSQSEYIVSSAGETIQVELRSNTAYEIEMPGVDWLRKNSSRSLSTYTHYFIVDPNETYDARSAVIRFIDRENGIEQAVTVTQMQRDAIVVAQNVYQIGVEGGALNFAVQANVDFTVSTNADWITQVEARGLTERMLCFEVTPNEGEEMREAVITLESGSVKQTIKVQQFGKMEEPFIDLSLQEYKVGNAGGTFQIDVRTNIEYQVIIPDESWIIETAYDGITHFFEVLLNDTYDARTAEIRFVNTEKGIEKTVTVTQEALYDILIEQSSYEIGAEGGVLDLPLQANMDFEVKTSEKWITQVNARGLTEQVLHFNVEENLQSNERTAVITISSPNVTHEIQVIQRGKEDPFLQLSLQEYQANSTGGVFSINVQANIEYQVIMPAENWITKTRSDGDTHFFDISPNETYDARTTEICFVNEEEGVEKTVTVKQTQLETIIVPQNFYTFGPEGGTLNLPVQASVDYEVMFLTDADWITHIETRGLTEKTLCFNIASNPTADNRETSIRLMGPNGVSQDIQILQHAKEPYLAILSAPDKIGRQEQEFVITAESDMDYLEVTMDMDWIQLINSAMEETGRGTYIYTYRFKAEQNETSDVRSGYITVAVVNHTINPGQYVYLEQEGRNDDMPIVPGIDDMPTEEW